MNCLRSLKNRANNPFFYSFFILYVACMLYVWYDWFIKLRKGLINMEIHFNNQLVDWDITDKHGNFDEKKLALHLSKPYDLYIQFRNEYIISDYSKEYDITSDYTDPIGVLYVLEYISDVDDEKIIIIESDLFNNIKSHIDDIPHLDYIWHFSELNDSIDDNGYFKIKDEYNRWFQLAQSLSYLDNKGYNLNKLRTDQLDDYNFYAYQAKKYGHILSGGSIYNEQK